LAARGLGTRETAIDEVLRAIQAEADLRGSMGNLLFLLGIAAAQKGAGSKPIERRHWVVSLVLGILIALLISAGAFGQPTMRFMRR
jgi:hypothetical protein